MNATDIKAATFGTACGNAAEERFQKLEQAKCVVVKVGSAVLTGEHGIDPAIIQTLVDGIALLRSKGKQVVLVSSGAVAAGRTALGGKKTASLPEKQAAAAIGQGLLMHFYEQAFARHNLLSAQILLTRDDLRSRQRFLNARNTFTTLLEMGAVPIVNENDTVVVDELKFGDNDSLASLLLNVVAGDLFINITSAPGVYATPPNTTSDADNGKKSSAQVLAVIEDVFALDLGAMCGGKTLVGTGGMLSKLMAAQRAAQIGVPTFIVPGREANVFERMFTDKTLGTWVCAAKKTLSRRKFWLAYQSDPAGTIHVDAGAAKALEDSGKSLLPGGITAVDGAFRAGSLVSVAYNDKSIAVGVSNYTAAELRKIMGCKRLEVAALLGNANYPEVIHRDNLVVHAVTKEE